MEVKKNKSIYVIGPTSSGKSDLAIVLAQEFSGEIISTDSRQIYRGMNIGTGKEPGTRVTIAKHPTVTKKPYISSKIKHYLIDSHSPHSDYSASTFVRQATHIQKDIWSRGKTPIICGGTMFWAQALLEKNSFPQIKPDKKLRKSLQQKTPQELYKILLKKDGKRARQLQEKNELNNKIRLIRAIEITESLGTVPTLEKADYENILQNNLILAPHLSKEDLEKNIKKRLKKRLDAGMLDEVYDLHHKTALSWSRLKNFGLEYKWCSLYLTGEITKDTFISKLETESLRYAKRQLTWMRRWQKAGAKITFVKDKKHAIRVAKYFLTS